jgi:UV DNA damage endonuclease
MIKRTWQKEGLPWASRLGVENTEILCGIIDWNNKNGIKVYRMTSDLLPWASEYEIESLPDWKTIRSNLERAAKIAQDGGQRLSFHPGQFNALTSPREQVVQNCVKDLRIHSEIMDAMGLPRNPGAKINIHLGGSFGEKEVSMDRWCKNFELLPESVKSRLTVENDDKAKCFSVIDLHKVWERTGVPTVFDSHHYEVGAKDSLTYEESIALASETWPSEIRQVCHLSNSAKIFEGKPVAVTAHSDYIHKPFNDCGLDVDVVIEAKAKELAVFDYIRKFGDLHGIKKVELPANLNTDNDSTLAAK